MTRNANPEIPSRAAHRELTGYGWQHAGAGTYTHPGHPGHVITVGAQGTGGTAHNGRSTVAYIRWTHREPTGPERVDRGVEALAYHLMTVACPVTRVTERWTTGWQEVHERLSDLRLAGYHGQATDMGDHITVVIDGGKRGKDLTQLPKRRKA